VIRAMYASGKTKGYCSPYGWNISLPFGWRVLPGVDGGAGQEFENIEVFAHQQDPSLSMTWMRTGSTAGRRLWHEFCQSTLRMGSIPSGQAQELIAQIFRLIGRVDTARVISLPDGQRALEITEVIGSSGSPADPVRGYHLVLPVRNSGAGPVYMQQLCFYARAGKFAQEIGAVMKSARSFRYFQEPVGKAHFRT
jgi:hypothetical protein